ncbi:hypothetical protein QO200_19005 [Flavobacterium sp. Arc3]|uniref:hypothetical protein n=1 Tax=Flavobacterium sp. Arc3 TaxID=3046686 RepID=UPI00352E5D5C
MKQTKTNKEILIAKGNFGRYHKPLAQQIGLEAVVLLEFLVDKYDYFIVKQSKYTMIDKNKAFYITYHDIEEATCINTSKLGRKSKSNPIEILINKGLIMKKTIQLTHLKTTYYTLFFAKIEKAYDSALAAQNKRRKEEKEAKELKKKKLLESTNKGIDDFLEINLSELKNSSNPNDSLILQNDSMETVKTSALNMQNKPITNNKRNKRMYKKKKLTSESLIEEDYEFTEKQLEDMLGENYFRAPGINSTIYDDEDGLINHSDHLYTLIIETRRSIKTPQVFFDEIVNVIFKDKFKGFKMSIKDELLIYDALINNPLFEDEDDDIIARDNAIVVLRNEYNTITEEEILEEIEFDEDKYDIQYNMVWEKILKNCTRIREGKLEARFGNIFVGVREFSANYRSFVEQC